MKNVLDKGLVHFFEGKSRRQCIYIVFSFIVTFWGGPFLAGNIGWGPMIVLSVPLFIMVIAIMMKKNYHPVFDILFPASLTTIVLWVYKIAYTFFHYSFMTGFVTTLLIVIVVCAIFYTFITFKKQGDDQCQRVIGKQTGEDVF